MGLRGVNLTIPHKEAACRLVDELDSEAALIGAINTIVNDDGHLKGYNTDGSGLLAALATELAFSAVQRRVLLLGAGGACRAALVALCRAGAAWVGIANRTRARAEALITEMSPRFPGTAFAALDLAGLPPAGVNSAAPVDLLVNTTAVGLRGEAFAGDMSLCVRSGGAVFDMVYSAAPTPLVAAARLRGLAAADGLAMLASQGEDAFRLWFGIAPPERLMMRTLTGRGHEDG